jgi:H+/Cl- antiporter ClcA
MLQGLQMKDVFSMRTYFAKVIGLTAIMLSGLSVGKKGSFVHLCVIIAENLPFQDLYKKNNTAKN